MTPALLTRIFLTAFWLQGATATLEALLVRPASGFLKAYLWTDLPLFVAALLVACAMVLSPRFPKRLLLPPVLFTLWQVPGALPLPLLLSDPAVSLTVAACQCLLGTFLLFWSRHWADNQWASGLQQRPRFSWTHLAAALGTALLLVAGFLLLCAQSALLWVDKKTAGYVRICRDGVVIEERHFKKDNQEVRLIGMVHIATPAFYESVSSRLPERDPAVMLLEGVTDRQNILATSFSYSKLAALLGLAAQSDSDLHRPGESHRVGPQRGLTRNPGPHIEYRHADVDISELQPLTLQFIRSVGKLLSSNSLLELLQKLQSPEIQKLSPEDTRSIMADILQKRNHHVLRQIDAELPSGRMILIPWGAAHLADIQTAILERGFRESARFPRLAIPFGPPKNRASMEPTAATAPVSHEPRAVSTAAGSPGSDGSPVPPR